MTTTVGFILLYTLAVTSEGETVMAHSQYDQIQGEPPKLYATRDECQQQLQNLVFGDDLNSYEVKVVKGGWMYAEKFETRGRGERTSTTTHRVDCFEVRDTPD